MKKYKILNIINSTKIVINAGKKDFQKNDKVIIYRLTDIEVKDLETGKNYGYLEDLVGYGQVTYLHSNNETCIIEPLIERRVTFFLGIRQENIRSEWDVIRETDLVRKSD